MNYVQNEQDYLIIPFNKIEIGGDFVDNYQEIEYFDIDLIINKKTLCDVNQSKLEVNKKDKTLNQMKDESKDKFKYKKRKNKQKLNDMFNYI